MDLSKESYHENDLIIQSDQSIHNYVEEKKEIYNMIINFLEDPQSNDTQLQDLITNIDNQQYIENKEEF